LALGEFVEERGWERERQKEKRGGRKRNTCTDSDV